MYLIFGGREWGIEGGASEYLGKRKCAEEARDFARLFVMSNDGDDGFWAHVFDLDFEKIVLIVTNNKEIVPYEDLTNKWMVSQ